MQNASRKCACSKASDINVTASTAAARGEIGVYICFALPITTAEDRRKKKGCANG